MFWAAWQQHSCCCRSFSAVKCAVSLDLLGFGVCMNVLKGHVQLQIFNNCSELHATPVCMWS